MIFRLRLLLSSVGLLTLVVLIQSCAFQNEVADLIIHNAVIYTVDEQFSTAEAMAIKDGKILEVGPERAILNKYKAARNIDVAKRFVYPGFIDAHCHFLGYGTNLLKADLIGSSSWDEVIERVQKYAPTRETEWIMGRGWNQEQWANNAFPNKAKLDSLFPNTPVYLSRIDGHAAIANSTALDLAGITSQSNVSGGSIGFENGELTGLLVDNAMTLVEIIIPSFTQEQKISALLKAQDNCFKVGLTTVDDAGLMKSDVDLMDSLQRAQQLKMRVYAMMSDDSSNFDYYLKHGIDTSSERLTIRSFKFYSDGALGSRGACLLQAYDDAPSTTGFLLGTEDHFRMRAFECYKAGFQVNTHAIGDSANRVILGIYGEILQGVNDHRWRIEHAQVVHKGDLDLFGQYNIIPSIQPVHATSDRKMALLRLGRNRIQRAYAYNELKKQTGLVALGTDFPVEDISPLATFRAAVYRVDQSSMQEGAFLPENALTPKEALMGMTLWAAISNFEENKKGSLQSGKYADFVILDKDILKLGAEGFSDLKVIATYIAGEEVYRYKK
jgi:predicted amidohydrolase YtcJ